MSDGEVDEAWEIQKRRVSLDSAQFNFLNYGYRFVLDADVISRAFMIQWGRFYRGEDPLAPVKFNVKVDVRYGTD